MRKFSGSSYRIGGHKSKVVVFIGFLIIVLTIIGFSFWVTVGEKAIMYKEIVVLSEDVPEHKTITKNMVTTLRVPEETLVKGAIKNSSQIIGKESQIYIPKGMQLVKEFFEEDSLSLSENEFVLSLPNEWILTYPQTLRRGDKVFLYPVVDEDKNNVGYEGIMDETIVPSLAVKDCVSATVFYVKDSTNREIKDTSTEPRFDGSGNVSIVEIIVTDKDYQELNSLYLLGNKFILLYQ